MLIQLVIPISTSQGLEPPTRRADPEWTNVAVTPTIGTNQTAFNFTATYMDSSNIGLTGNSSALYVYDEQENLMRIFPMLPVDPNDNDYTDGRVFYVDISSYPEYLLEMGVYSFEVVGWPIGSIPPDGPNVTSSRANGPFISGFTLQVLPTSGTPRDLFMFTTTYYDFSATALTNVMLHVGGSSWAMDEADSNDNDYTDGKVFTNSTFLDGGTHMVYASGQTINGQLTTPSFMIVVNTIPTLSDGSVTPSSGTTSTIFEYQVTYTDAEGDLPNSILVYIDSVAYTMLPADSDTDVTDGKLYSYSSDTGAGPLSQGNHRYYFYANDSVNLYDGAYINETDGPVVGAAIYDVAVSPDIGMVAQTKFNFTCTYLDVDGTLPWTIVCVVNTTSYLMTATDPNQTPSGGKQYFVNTTVNQTGTLEWYISMTNPKGTFTSDTGEIYLGGSVVPAPQITGYQPLDATTSLQMGESLLFQVTVSNPEAPYSYLWTIDTGSGPIPYGQGNDTPVNQFIFNSTGLLPGIVYLNITINNQHGQSVSHSWAIEILTIFGTLMGQVKDAQMNPLISVEVEITDQSTGIPTSTLTTNATGYYSITTLGVGNYSVRVFKAGYTSYETNVMILEDTIRTLDVTLAIIPPGTFSGTITDDLGDPITSATLTFTNLYNAQVFTTTATNGVITPLEVPAGPYNITISVTDYRLYQSSTGVGQGVTQTLAIILERVTGGVNGTVLPIGSGSDEEDLYTNIMVLAAGTSISTMADTTTGAFTLMGLEPGTYNISAYRNAQFLTSNPSVTVLVEQTTTITLVYDPSQIVTGGLIEGTVTSDEEGGTSDDIIDPENPEGGFTTNGLLGVTVWVQGYFVTTHTDSDGTYSLPLAPGTYTIQYTKDGYEPVTKTGVVVGPGAIVRLDIIMNQSAVTYRGSIGDDTFSVSYMFSVRGAGGSGPTVAFSEVSREIITIPVGYNATELIYRVYSNLDTDISVSWASVQLNYVSDALPTDLESEDDLLLWFQPVGSAQWEDTGAAVTTQSDTVTVNSTRLLGTWIILYVPDGGSGPGPDPLGQAKPAVITSSLSPSPGSTGVSVNTSFSVTFSKKMDRTSVQNALAIVPYTTCTISWNNEDTTLTYTPDSALKYNQPYTVSLGTLAKDVWGKFLNDTDGVDDQVYSWTFTTMSDSVSPGGTVLYTNVTFVLSHKDKYGDVQIRNYSGEGYGHETGVDIVGLSSYRAGDDLLVILELSGNARTDVSYTVYIINKSYQEGVLLSNGVLTDPQAYYSAEFTDNTGSATAAGNIITFTLSLSTLQTNAAPPDLELFAIALNKASGSEYAMDAAGSGTKIIESQQEEVAEAKAKEEAFPILTLIIIAIIIGGVIGLFLFIRHYRAKQSEYYDLAEYDENGEIIEEVPEEGEFEYLGAGMAEEVIEYEPPPPLPDYEAPERIAAKEDRVAREVAGEARKTGGEELLLDDSLALRRRGPDAPSVGFDELTGEGAEPESEVAPQPVPKGKPKRGPAGARTPPSGFEDSFELDYAPLPEDDDGPPPPEDLSASDMDFDLDIGAVPPKKKKKGKDDDLFDTFFEDI